MLTKVFSICLLILSSAQLIEAQGLTVHCDSNNGPTSQNLIDTYSDTCTATGGTAPYTWSLSSAILPAGLQVNGQSATSNIVANAITISGVVQQTGQYYYSFGVHDSSTPYQSYGYSPYFSGTINPLLTALDPAYVGSGGPDLTITATGAGFANSNLDSSRVTVVTWNGTNLTTTYIDASHVTAIVPANLTAAPGTASVQVIVGSVYGSSFYSSVTSSPLTFAIDLPAITSLSPASAQVNGAGFALTVNGSGFVSGATVLWNGAALATTLVNATQLTATVPASLLTSVGTFQVNVVSGGVSTSNLAFTIAPATITSLSPSAAIATGPAFTLIVTGAGFDSNAVVLWSGTSLPTTFISGTQLTAAVPATLIANAGTFAVQVKAGGALTPTSLPFTVAPAPTLASLNPTSVTAGGAAFNLSITGAAIASDAVVFWNGRALNTTFISPTSLSAAVSSSLIASAGTAQITIKSSGLTTAPLPLTIMPGPAISSLSPASATVTDPALTLRVNGTAFASDSVVFWGAAALTTMVVSPTQLTAAVPASFLTSTGSFSITVASRGVVSNASLFNVNPIPTPAVSLTGLQPTAMPATSLNVGVQVANTSAYDMQGTLQLSFTPSVSGLPAGYIDPALQFASGGTSVNFTLASGSTVASVPQGGVIQLGTVAGTITVSMTSLTANGVNVLPSAAVTGTVIVSPLPPVIVTDSAKIINVTDGGFTVQLTGYSTTREVSSADFVLTAAPGARLLGSSDIVVQTGNAFAAWFGSTQSQTYGSQFVLQVPFTVSGGTSNIVQSISVTLSNSAGTSTAVTVTK